MHVGVKKIIPKDLREKDFDPVFGQPLEVHAGRLQAVNILDRDAGHQLQREHIALGQLPVDPGHVITRLAPEIAPELRGVGGLAFQIEFIQQGLFKLLDHAGKTQRPALRIIFFGLLGEVMQQRHVLADQGLDTRPEHLDNKIPAILQFGAMHLGHRGRGQRFLVKLQKDLVQVTIIGLFNNPARHLARKRRHGVLQAGEFIGDIGRQQVPAGGEDLAELDIDRPEFFQHQTHAPRAGTLLAPEPVPRQQVKRKPKGAEQVGGEDKFIQAVFDKDPLHGQQAQEAGHGQASPARCSSRASRCSSRSASWRNVSTASQNSRTCRSSGSNRSSKRRYSLRLSASERPLSLK